MKILGFIAFSAILLIAAIYDYRTKTIPLIFPILILLCGLFINTDQSILTRIYGLVALSLCLYIPALFIADAFGGGDIKLVGALGFTLGLNSGLLGLFLCVFLSLFPLLYYKIFSKYKKTHIAFAPIIAIAFIPIVYIQLFV